MKITKIVNVLSLQTGFCTCLRMATQQSLQESSLEMLKIPKKKSKAGGGGGSANLNFGDEDSVDGGVSRSRKVAATRGIPKG